MIETKLEWYSPNEKMPDDDPKCGNDILWITKKGSLRLGFFLNNERVWSVKRAYWYPLNEWFFGEDSDGYDMYDNTDEVFCWAYVHDKNFIMSLSKKEGE